MHEILESFRGNDNPRIRGLVGRMRVSIARAQSRLVP